MRTFKTTLTVFAMLAVFILVSPNTLAALSFDNEYELEQIRFDVRGRGGPEMDLFDIERFNNVNNTLIPLMEEDARFRGIVQASPTFPIVVGVENATPVSGIETYVLAWLFVPSRRRLHDTVFDGWLRLPVNNLTDWGNNPGEVAGLTLRINRLFINEYNVTLGPDIGSSFVVPGPHGQTPHYVLGDTNYSQSLFKPNYRHMDERRIEWNSSYNDVNVSHNHTYNFTYVRVSTPLHKGIPYVFMLEIRRVRGDGLTNPPLELLFTEGDNNNDGVFRSHLYYEGQQFNMNTDFDAPFIATEVGSRGTSGIGFVEAHPGATLVRATNRLTFESVVSVTNAHYISMTFLVFSLTNASIDVETDVFTGEFNLTPGFNTVTAEGKWTSGNMDIDWIQLDVTMSVEDALNISFVSCSVPPWEIFSSELLLWSFVAPLQTAHHYSTQTILHTYQISTSRASYIPLDLYDVYVVPNPADYNASMLYVNYSEQYAHLLETFVFRKEDEGKNIYQFLFELWVIGIISIALGPALPLAAYLYINRAWVMATWGRVWSWLESLVPDAPEWVLNFFNTLYRIGWHIWQILEAVVHALSWLVTHGLHILALWVVISVYLMAVYATNGLCDAVVSSRRTRRRGDVFNVRKFDECVQHAFKNYMRLATFNMSLVAAMVAIMLAAIRMVSPL